MAVHRGIQSAIFYYLSCAPCANVRDRKRRKRDAKQSRRDRLELEQNPENIYIHPGEPSSTNPGWQSELTLGPHGRRKKQTGNSSQRGWAPSRTSDHGSTHTSSVDLPRRLASQDTSWNHQLYQREDEGVWGSSSNMGGSQYAGSLSVPERVVTADSIHSTGSSYHATRNPSVNEMHPATVTRVTAREDVRWMMQPPPVADVMSGKQRAPRSSSDSGGSWIGPGSTNLSREVSHRLIERKLHCMAPSATAMSRESSRRGSNGPSGQRHDRISEQDFATSPPSAQRRPSSIDIGRNVSEDSAATAVRHADLAPGRQAPRRAASRPQLSTIFSDNDAPTELSSSDSKSRSEAENSIPTPSQSGDEGSGTRAACARPPTLAAPEKALTAKPSGVTSRRTIVAHHAHEDSDISIRDGSWYAEHFDPIEWIHKHTMREVHGRRSMDF